MDKENKPDIKYRIMVILAAALIIIIILFVIKRITDPKRISAHKSGFALDTVVSITLYGKGDALAAEDLINLCSYYEDRYFSPTKPESELYRINHIVWTPQEMASNESKIIEISEDMYNVMNQALKYYEVTDGRYNIAVRPITQLWDFHDPDKAVVPDFDMLSAAVNNVGKYGSDYRIETDFIFRDENEREKQYDYALILNRPVMFDIGSAAKGYIADRIREKAYSKGITSLLTDLGGNICCGEMRRGFLSGESGFNIGIDTSFLADRVEDLKVFIKPENSVVTSGKYMRCFDKEGKHYHHIIDAVTGYPVETDLASVTVIGPCSCECDILSTVCFMLGEERSADLLEREGYKAVFVYDDGTVKR